MVRKLFVRLAALACFAGAITLTVNGITAGEDQAPPPVDGVDGGVFEAFQRYDPRFTVADLKELTAFVEGIMSSGQPRGDVLAHFAEFCAADTIAGTGRDADKCKEAFEVLLDRLYEGA